MKLREKKTGTAYRGIESIILFSFFFSFSSKSISFFVYSVFFSFDTKSSCFLLYTYTQKLTKHCVRQRIIHNGFQLIVFFFLPHSQFNYIWIARVHCLHVAKQFFFYSSLFFFYSKRDANQYRYQPLFFSLSLSVCACRSSLGQFSCACAFFQNHFLLKATNIFFCLKFETNKFGCLNILKICNIQTIIVIDQTVILAERKKEGTKKKITAKETKFQRKCVASNLRYLLPCIHTHSSITIEFHEITTSQPISLP